MKLPVNLENHQAYGYGGFGKVRALLAVCAIFAFCDKAFALDPPPGGGYPQNNTALGEDALFSATTGGLENTALGYQALYSNPDNGGAGNTAVGRSAMHNNTTGGGNVAVGSDALYDNTTATTNVGVGSNALIANTTGNGNVAVGATALQAHAISIGNTAVGFGVMSIGSTGNNNTAVGNVAMAFATGSDNTGVGDGAMNGATGSDNIAIGRSAGLNLAGDSNIVIGQYGGQNITNGANNIDIGNQGAAHDANIIRLGDTAVQRKTFIAGISGTAVANGVAVMVTNKGQLGVATSSARFKDDIKPMDKASEAILALKPVTFRYKQELDPKGIPQFGLVAEQVEKVNPDLVARDEEGKPYTVRYEAVNAMLLNEFLKEHRTVQELKKEIAALTATVQKVSAQVEMSRPAPQTVVDNH